MKSVILEFSVAGIIILVIFLGGLLWLNGMNMQEDEGSLRQSFVMNGGGINNETQPMKDVKKLPNAKTEDQWKTYEHEKLGFRLSCSNKYLPQADVDEEGNVAFFVRNIADEIEGSCNDECCNCALSVQIRDVKHLGNLAKDPETLVQALNEKGMDFSETVIDGQRAYKYAEGGIYVVFFQEDAGYMRYDFLVSDSEMGEKILDTFKFPPILSQATLQ